MARCRRRAPAQRQGARLDTRDAVGGRTGDDSPRPRCDACGLDYGFADAGDGPAVFIMFLAGFIAVGAALIVEALYHPPYWVHAVLWLPLILIVTLGPLRPMKGLMIALQYHRKAAEQKFSGSGDVR